MNALIDQARLKEMALEATGRLRRIEFPIGERDPKLAAVSDALRSAFGCERENVAGLMAAYMGVSTEELMPFEDQVLLREYSLAVIFPIEAGAEGDIVMLLRGRDAADVNGYVDEVDPDRDSFRPATDEEIEAFFEVLCWTGDSEQPGQLLYDYLVN
jgi:hypothetical protein